MMQEQIDDPFDLFDSGCARSLLDLLFAELISERNRIATLADRARMQNDPRLERVEACGRVISDRLTVWLDRWIPPEPPN
jgi:hypothetical protein